MIMTALEIDLAMPRTTPSLWQRLCLWFATGRRRRSVRAAHREAVRRMAGMEQQDEDELLELVERCTQAGDAARAAIVLSELARRAERESRGEDAAALLEWATGLLPEDLGLRAQLAAAYAALARFREAAVEQARVASMLAPQWPERAEHARRRADELAALSASSSSPRFESFTEEVEPTVRYERGQLRSLLSDTAD